MSGASVSCGRLLSVGLAFGVILGALLALCGWYYDWSYVEKMLTKLAMPTGLLALTLVFATFVSLMTGRRRWAVFLSVICLFYWTFGCTYTANIWMGLLEGRFQPVDPTDSPTYDVVVVLGGATYSDASDNVWLSPHGDRVMLAARLFHQGRVDQLITTGKLYDWYGDNGLDLSTSTERLWREIGIPGDRITQLGGVNTTEEMKALREHFGVDPPERIGLLTSAFHLRRAMRLAREQGLELIPIPCGFTVVEEPVPLSWIPSSYGFRLSELAAKEFLAAVVNR